MKNVIIQKIPYYRHGAVIMIMENPTLSAKDKARKIYDYACDYERKTTNGMPNHVISPRVIESVLMAIDSVE